MKIDNSFDALFNPGKADNFFTLKHKAPLHLRENSFNLWNAWWLAELSRLIYRDNLHKNHQYDSIEEILAKVELSMVGEIINKETSVYGIVLQAKGIDTTTKQRSDCIILIFCGTTEYIDWRYNLHAYQYELPNKGKVHIGFHKAFLSVQEQLLNMNELYQYPLFITGHSLGAAMATLTSSLLSDKNIDLQSCYTFGSPRVGDQGFVKSLSSCNIYRVINDCDIVTMVPFDFAGIQYSHAGEAYFLDSDGNLSVGMAEEVIDRIQKSKYSQLKDYLSVEKILSKVTAFKTEPPSFLADHAPVNYVARIEHNLIRIIDDV